MTFFDQYVKPLLIAIPLTVAMYIPIILFLELAHWIGRFVMKKTHR